MIAPAKNPADRLLIDFFEQTYRPQRLLDASPMCVNQYRNNIKKLGRVLGREPMLSDLNAESITSVMAELRLKNRSPNTANKVRAQLVAMWRYCAQRHLLEDWPDVRKLVAYRRIPTSWTADELSRIMAAAALINSRQDEPIPASLWWRALLLLTYDCGGRIGAILQLRWEHIDLTLGHLIIPAEFQKCRQDQVFRVHPQTIEALRQIQTPERAIIFPIYTGAHTVYRRYGSILRAAGLPCTRRDKFHKLRRTHATLLAAEAGIEAASWSLGHAHEAMTREHYIDPRMLPQANMSDKLPRPELPTAPVIKYPITDRQLLILRAIRDGVDVATAIWGVVEVKLTDAQRASKSKSLISLNKRGLIVRNGKQATLTDLGRKQLALRDSGKAGAQ